MPPAPIRPVSAAGIVTPAVAIARLAGTLNGGARMPSRAPVASPAVGAPMLCVSAPAEVGLPSATAAAAAHLAELAARKRSISATLRRVRCEQEQRLVEDRRTRALSRLQRRIEREASSMNAKDNRRTVRGGSSMAAVELE